MVHKAPSAVVEIPEIEFEIGADAKRKIDSVYNHISSAVYNLSMHVSTLGSQLSGDTKAKIAETIDELNKLLDVDKPWTFILHDRTGISEIRPEDEVETVYGGQVRLFIIVISSQGVGGCGQRPVEGRRLCTDWICIHMAGHVHPSCPMMPCTRDVYFAFRPKLLYWIQPPHFAHRRLRHGQLPA